MNYSTDSLNKRGYLSDSSDLLNKRAYAEFDNSDQLKR
jgi:hypothetical protein